MLVELVFTRVDSVLNKIRKTMTRKHNERKYCVKSVSFIVVSLTHAINSVKFLVTKFIFVISIQVHNNNKNLILLKRFQTHTI